MCAPTDASCDVPACYSNQFAMSYLWEVLLAADPNRPSNDVYLLGGLLVSSARPLQTFKTESSIDGTAATSNAK
jgi:hypothetical protein